MNWTENFLIIAGISLDIFAAMECHGAMVAKVQKRILIELSLLAGFWQFAALFVGNFLSELLIRRDGIAENERFIGYVIAAVIFLALGVRLGAKAIRNEIVDEHREDTIRYKKFFCMLASTSLYTILAGIAFGFVKTNVWVMLVCIMICSLLAVIAGTYTGYHLGAEQRRKAYGMGAFLLVLAGADVIVRHILKLF